MNSQSFDKHTDIQTRQANYDLLRIISTVAVILIHANWYYFKPIYENPELSFTWVVLALINIITRFSVPAFVLLSGAFILSNEKNADSSRFYKKSLKNIFLPTAMVIVFLIIVQICINIIKHNGIFHDLKGVLQGGFYNLWYIYMLGGLYFLTPFIVKLKKVISWKQYRILAVVMILWAIISQATSDEKLAYSIGVCFAFLAYYLLGDVLKTEIQKGWKPRRWLLIIVSIICIIISFVWRAMGHNYYISKAYINFFSPTMVVYSLCIFLLFGTLRIKRDWSKVSGITFEIYLIHTLILKGLAPAIQIEGEGIHPILGVGLLGAVTLIVSCIAAIGFKRLWKTIIEKKYIDKAIDNMKMWKLFY